MSSIGNKISDTRLATTRRGLDIAADIVSLFFLSIPWNDLDLRRYDEIDEITDQLNNENQNENH